MNPIFRLIHSFTGGKDDSNKKRTSKNTSPSCLVAEQDSNLRPSGYEPDELPTALSRVVRANISLFIQLTRAMHFFLVTFVPYAKAHKAGFVSIVGNPNVGKSTLMNAWIGEKLSIITPKAQTTRHRILGILNAEEYQLVLSDTPGVIKPSYEMQNSMMDFVKTALEDADVLIYMLEIGEKQMKDQQLFEKIQRLSIPVIVLINKIDLADQAALINQQNIGKNSFQRRKFFHFCHYGVLCSRSSNYIIDLLPLSPPYFPKDQLTDKPERFFVNEAIREQILKHYDKEVPMQLK